MVEAHRHARIVGQAELRVPLQGWCAPFAPSPPPRLLARMRLPRARFPRGHSASPWAAGERRWGATGGGGDRRTGRTGTQIPNNGTERVLGASVKGSLSSPAVSLGSQVTRDVGNQRWDGGVL